MGGDEGARKMTWKELKKSGSEHYKVDPNKIEPIDLYKDGGILQDFAIGSIIKYAYRNRKENGTLKIKDLDKIIHYAEYLKAYAEEQECTCKPGDVIYQEEQECTCKPGDVIYQECLRASYKESI
jgi:hypothetical protein